MYLRIRSRGLPFVWRCGDVYPVLFTHLQNSKTGYHTIYKFSKKWDILVDETYDAACKAELQLFNQSNSQLTYFVILQNQFAVELTTSYSYLLQQSVVMMNPNRDLRMCRADNKRTVVVINLYSSL